ncbi:hypothetical protein B0H65DRAFT_283855 [Neurospora tetraspora]|uniref:DUF8021 domain-containing protein n=1 Tax=Neurospora tetraspora TaxID=94610 RepID=A0AAE0MNB7_9PEZI|nr:hypothetical protein B0H65DRAFT_283855 [Neurospora tetraspora]
MPTPPPISSTKKTHPPSPHLPELNPLHPPQNRLPPLRPRPPSLRDFHRTHRRQQHHHPYVIHTRIEVSPLTLLPTVIESIVTDEGDWLFNATGTLTLTLQEGSWPPIPIPLTSSLRNSNTYAEIQAVGDSYFNRFANTSVSVPWGPPFLRIEGSFPALGNLITSTGDCIQEWPASTIIVPWRRYVVDQEMGTVDIFVGFPIPGLDRS